MATLHTEARAHKPAVPAPAARLDDPPVPAARALYRLRRDSDLNRRGHAIVAAAEKLLKLIDAMEVSGSQESLEAAIADATPDEFEFDLGCLERLAADCAGFRWGLDIFIDQLKCELIPLPNDPDLVAARTPRSAKKAGRRVPR